MWLETPQTLREQLRDDIRQHSKPSGCVQTQLKARRKSHPEWDDVAAERDPKRKDAAC